MRALIYSILTLLVFKSYSQDTIRLKVSSNATGITSVIKGWGIIQDGTITTFGTITADSLVVSTKSYRQKGIDSLSALLATKLSATTASTQIHDSLSANSLVIDTLSVGQGTTASPLRNKNITTTSNIDTAVAQWFRSLPGYIGDGSNSLRDNFTWGASAALTQLSTPTLTAGTPTSSTVPLSWTSVTNATAYSLDKSTDNSTWTNIYNSTGTSYTATGLTASSLFYFRVKATATGYTTSSYSATTATTAASGPAYVTWSSIGVNMEQYNSNFGMRKKSGVGSGWDNSNSSSTSSQTLASGQKVVIKIPTNPALAAVFALSNSGSVPDPSNGINANYNFYTGYGLTANAQMREFGTAVGSNFAIAAGNLIRFNYGSSLTYELSTDGGSTWVVKGTATATPTGTYNIYVQAYSPLGGYDEVYKQ